MSTLDTNSLEKTATEYIPYTLQYDHFTCGTVDADLTRTIRLQGVPFETLSNERINGYTVSANFTAPSAAA